MTIEIKNKKLHRKVQARLNNLTNKSLRLLAKGKLKESKKLEKQIHKLYLANYPKIYKITKNK